MLDPNNKRGSRIQLYVLILVVGLGLALLIIL
jgi:hypothetical protein